MNSETLFSFSRESMLARCVREYFLHAFYAYGEYETGVADRERNHVHLLKQLKSDTLFKNALIHRVLREIFIDGMPLSDLKREVLHEFYLAKDWMLLGEYEFDHLQHPLLKSFYYEEKNFADIFTNLQNELVNWCDKLLANDLLSHLFNEEPQNFYPVDDVPSVFVGNIKIHFPMLGIIKSNNDYYCLNFTASPDFYSTQVCLHLFFCQHNLFISPERVRHVFISETAPVTLLDKDFDINISTEIHNIAQHSAPHLRLIDELKNITDPFSIPLADSPEICSVCRFREFCRG